MAAADDDDVEAACRRATSCERQQVRQPSSAGGLRVAVLGRLVGAPEREDRVEIGVGFEAR